MMCWTSLHVSEGFASSERAMMAAAMGALALVPVCLAVQLWCKSVVTTCRSFVVPELKMFDKFQISIYSRLFVQKCFSQLLAQNLLVKCTGI